MLLKTKLTLPVATWMILTICLSIASSCAAELVVKTWYLDASLLALVRRDAHGNIREQKPISEADGYRCYSRPDDEAWRADLRRADICCKSKGN